MQDLSDKTGVWFVYDGDCPICTRAADALRIKQTFGELSTLNARDSSEDPLLKEINRLKLDLDEGMVIYLDGKFYHGKEALKFMAEHGQASNGFMAATKSLFWSDALSQLMYPWMRGCRNWLLKRNKVARIDNLGLKQEPIFKSVFGDDWEKLPPVMKKHYANCPYTGESHRIEGRLQIYCKPPLLWLAPILGFMGQIPAVNKNQVSTSVRFESDLDSKALHFKRHFHLSGKKPYIFNSRLFQVQGNEVVEVMKFGLGWRASFSWDGEKVVLAHRGYSLKIFGHFLPLPLTQIMGAGSAVEYPIDDNRFSMETQIDHPWWGKMYGYRGQFSFRD